MGGRTNPDAGTDVWAVYADQFYKGAASVIHRRLGKGTVTYIGTDTDDGKLEKEVVRRYMRKPAYRLKIYHTE